MEKIKIAIPIDSILLKGKLVIPKNATGIVVFCNGCSSTKLSTRNKILSELIQKDRIGTLVFNLLTEEEEKRCENKFDIDLLVSRLIATTEWLIQNKSTNQLPIGYLGSNMGAAAAMRAAAYFGKTIKAVVSRSGRPDMAVDSLSQVTSPTLLIVDGIDIPIIDLNKMAFDELQSEKEMKIIPKIPTTINESKKLHEGAEAAISWFQNYFTLKE
ncbi:dienelactone hydrolase family protein [Flavobacterium algicola]|uniref:alpha/beta hydrolase n=1 Tax=Flavobacterium algicola TaxID=556529 RepID=UPI001EFED2D1|nr:alpha/beta hydrolase [Flavobacterium algicola]MCG9790941.1 alpha/beta hydrolase [Flavobacterium algicola]